MLSCAILLLFVFEHAVGQLTLSEMFNKSPCSSECLAYLGILHQGVVDH